MSKPTKEDLDVLVCWPAGTVGEQKERELVSTMLKLCEEHGFGRVTQLAQEIEDIWRRPDRVEFYAKRKIQHVAMVQECIEKGAR